MGDKRLKRQLVTYHSLLATERKAFTLIELLVVIAVIAVLMAVLLPVLGRVRKQAKSVVCQSNLQQWGIAFSMYVGDHDGRMPGGTGWRTRTTYWPPWFFPLQTYTTHYEDILLCPTATTPRYSSRTSVWAWSPLPDDSSRDTHMRIVGSYGYNSYNGWLAVQSYDRVGGHAGIPVVFDCFDGYVGPEHYHDPPGYEDHFVGRQWEFPGGFTRIGGMTFVCINRHSGGINMLFRDWSVRKVGLKENWTLKWHREFDTSGPWTMAGGVQPEDWPEWMREFKDY